MQVWSEVEVVCEHSNGTGGSYGCEIRIWIEESCAFELKSGWIDTPIVTNDVAVRILRQAWSSRNDVREGALWQECQKTIVRSCVWWSIGDQIDIVGDVRASAVYISEKENTGQEDWGYGEKLHGFLIACRVEIQKARCEKTCPTWWYLYHRPFAIASVKHDNDEGVSIQWASSTFHRYSEEKIPLWPSRVLRLHYWTEKNAVKDRNTDQLNFLDNRTVGKDEKWTVTVNQLEKKNRRRGRHICSVSTLWEQRKITNWQTTTDLPRSLLLMAMGQNNEVILLFRPLCHPSFVAS